MAVTNVYGTTDRATGDSTHGQNTIIHYYDKAGVKAANAVNVYQQFADRRSMPLKRGTTYKVSKWLHIYDRLFDPDNQHGGTHADFEAKGYLSSRNIVDVSAGLTGAALAEGAGAVNKQSIKKITIETNFARYGEMLDYTDEVDMFAEDMVQVHYREELGLLANRRYEDLIQLDMLATPTVMYSGTATSLKTVGGDVTAADNSEDDLARVSYDLIRKAVRKLVRNRAMKNTSIVTGSTKIDTRVINKAFYAIIGPEVKYDLENTVRGTVAANGTTEYAYIPAYKYADATNLAEGEVGAMNDVRFIESESQVVYAGAGAVAAPAAAGDTYAGDLSTTTYANGAAVAAVRGTVYDRVGDAEGAAGAGTDALEYFDVFPILFPTKGSFATVGLKGHGKIKFNSQAPSKIELSNPYGTQGFFSYNMWYAGLILREERLLKVLVCASR
jgi:N4-gp56 family major capsid protein